MDAVTDVKNPQSVSSPAAVDGGKGEGSRVADRPEMADGHGPNFLSRPSNPAADGGDGAKADGAGAGKQPTDTETGAPGPGKTGEPAGAKPPAKTGAEPATDDGDKTERFFLGEPEALGADGQPLPKAKTAEEIAAEALKTALPDTFKRLEALNADELVAALEPLGLNANDVKQIIDLSKTYGKHTQEVGEARKAAARAKNVEEALSHVVQMDDAGKITRFNAIGLWNQAVTELGPEVALQGLNKEGLTIVRLDNLQRLQAMAQGHNGRGSDATEQALRAVGKTHAALLKVAAEAAGVVFDPETMPLEDLENLVTAVPKANLAFPVALRQAEREADQIADQNQRKRAQQVQAQRSELEAQETQLRKDIPHFEQLTPKITEQHMALYDRPFDKPGARIVPAKLMKVCTEAALFHDLKGRVPGYIAKGVKAGVAAELKRLGVKPPGEAEEITEVVEGEEQVETPPANRAVKFDETGPKFAKR